MARGYERCVFGLVVVLASRMLLLLRRRRRFFRACVSRGNQAATDVCVGASLLLVVSIKDQGRSVQDAVNRCLTRAAGVSLLLLLFFPFLCLASVRFENTIVSLLRCGGPSPRQSTTHAQPIRTNCFLFMWSTTCRDAGPFSSTGCCFSCVREVGYDKLCRA